MYVVYYFVVDATNRSRNNKTRYYFSIKANLNPNELNQQLITKINSLFAQIHILGKTYGKSDIIGLNISSFANNLDIVINTTNENSIKAIKQAFSKNTDLKYKISDISQFSNWVESLPNKSLLYSGEVLVRKEIFPIRNEFDFGKDLLDSLINSDDCILSFTFSPTNLSSQIEQQVAAKLRQKHNHKGNLYVSEFDKKKAELLIEKNQFPNFRTKIEVISSSKETLKEIQSRFSILSTGHNNFFATGARRFNVRNFNKIAIDSWFTYLFPKTGFYLNTNEISHLVQFLKVEKNKEINDRIQIH